MYSSEVANLVFCSWFLQALPEATGKSKFRFRKSGMAMINEIVNLAVLLSRHFRR